MAVELKYHENLADRLAAEGWRTVVLYPAFRFSLGWAAFFVVLDLVAGMHRDVPAIVVVSSPAIAGIIGFFQAMGGASQGRDLIVIPHGCVVLQQYGRTLISKELSKIAFVETVNRSPKQVTLRISFSEGDADSILFSATSTSAQQEELLNALAKSQKT